MKPLNNLQSCVDKKKSTVSKYGGKSQMLFEN